MARIFRDLYVQQIYAAGVMTAMHVRPERARTIFREDPDWRSPFLFFFQDKVELEYHITEKIGPTGSCCLNHD
jgi:hypothetical protein